MSGGQRWVASLGVASASASAFTRKRAGFMLALDSKPEVEAALAPDASPETT